MAKRKPLHSFHLWIMTDDDDDDDGGEGEGEGTNHFTIHSLRFFFLASVHGC